MKFKHLLVFSILPIVLSLVSLVWWKTQLLPTQPGSTRTVTLVVNHGAPASLVVSDLAQNGLIKSILAAKIYLKLNQKETSFRPGVYLISPALSFPEIVTKISQGPEDIRVTIPEGFRHEQIAKKLNDLLTSPGSKFDVNRFLMLTTSLEGQLFPDTYSISPTATAEEVIKLILNNFEKKTELKLESEYVISMKKDITLTGEQILILASIIEREGKGTDKPVIAGILLNRLAEGWTLDVDATIQYAVDSRTCITNLLTCNYWKPIFDTHFSSPYNTYIHIGLPPGPISNPGLNSIQAVLKPTDNDCFFYLHDSLGITRYAKTLTEHHSNIDKYLKP